MRYVELDEIELYNNLRDLEHLFRKAEHTLEIIKSDEKIMGFGIKWGFSKEAQELTGFSRKHLIKILDFGEDNEAILKEFLNGNFLLL